MTNKEKIIILLFNSLISVICVLGIILLLPDLEWYMKVLTYGCIAVFSLGTFLFFALKLYKLAKSCFSLNVVLLIILAVFFLFNICGLFENLSDLENIKKTILNSGSWGVVVCILIQLLQVVVLPAPGFIFYLATTAIYGSLWGFVISYTSTVLGSIIAFFIGKFFGKKAVVWCIGKEDTEKYSTLISKKGKVPFIIMQILPFFPDDILCMVAGLSNMSYKFFISAMIFVKPIYIAFVCFLGTGHVIPYSGWGIFCWIAIFLVLISVGLLYIKYQEKIDNYIKNKFSRKKKD